MMSPVPPEAEVLEQGRQTDFRLRLAILHSRKARIRAAVGLVALVASFAVGYVLLAATVFGPQRTVEAYATALAADDAPTALALVSPSTLEGVSRSLLTSQMLAMSDVEIAIGDVSRGGGTARVSAQVDGASTTFLLARKGFTGGIFPRWRLVTPFSSLDLAIGLRRTSLAATVEVNGVEVRLGESGPVVFPGRYTVTVPARYPFLSSHVVVTAPGGEAVTVDVPLSLDPALQSDTQRTVDDFLERCARYRRPSPSGCPFRYDGFTRDLTSSDWTVTRLPVVSVDRAPEGNALLVTTIVSGQARYLARREGDDPSEPPTVDEVVTFDVTGTVQGQADRSLYFRPERRRRS